MVREASHLGQPALGRPEQESRRLATLQGCMSGSGTPSSTAAHGEGSLEGAEAGRLWDTDTHTWGPRHRHPLTVPHAALNFWPSCSSASSRLGLSPAPRASHSVPLRLQLLLLPPHRLPDLGLGSRGQVSPLFLPSSVFPRLKPRVTFRENKQWSFFPTLSVLLTSEEASPSPSGMVRSVRLGDFASPTPTPWEPPLGPAWECWASGWEAQL